MGLFSKKKKKTREPQYELSPTHIQTTNYRVYYMRPLEKVLYFLLAFVTGAAVGYLFYGGIGKDEYGNATTVTYVMNVIVSVGGGLLAAKLYLPARTRQILAKRKKQLARQFRDMLDGIATSIGAGNNVAQAFNSVYEDLKIQYEEDAFILKELEVILSGVHSNFNIEDLLEDFGRRSGNDDIKSFANVFKVCYRKGGNIQEVIRTTHAILSKKMEIMDEIETTVSGSKLNQNIMIVMPVIIVGIIKIMSPEFADNFVTPAGLIATTLAAGLFVAAYFIGKSILNIKI